MSPLSLPPTPGRFHSFNPATGEPVWSGLASDANAVDAAIRRARLAQAGWARRPLTEREAVLQAFASALAAHRDELAELISREVGKPRWEALTEVSAMIGKIPLSIEAQQRRCGDLPSATGVTRFRPHGVVAVLGPFNFPGHLPNGHIAPALLAGNAAVFKPSEYAPAVAEKTAALWQLAGLPAGLLEVLPGGRETGELLAAHPGLDGLFFTGSSRTGLALSRQFAATPERILALEMGGNNPLVVAGAADHGAAATLTAQSAFITAGQRCTCARRLIVPVGADGDAFLETLAELVHHLRIGVPTDSPEPFMGPVISAPQALRLLAAQRDLIDRGARPLVEMHHPRPGTGLVSPALLDVTSLAVRDDTEHFGPLLQLIRVPDFDAAIEEANRTQFGLAAGLLSDDPELYCRFRTEVRAGLINWNQPLTGASSAAAFGGIGRSGNHRPSAYLAADYCSYPVASLETPTLRQPEQLPPGLRWPP